MTQQATKPMILLAFANDRGGRDEGYLRNLPEELRRLRAVLEGVALGGVTLLPNATLDEILDTFQKQRDRIAIFHYGGHANSYQLALEDKQGGVAAAYAGGLATFLAQQQGLQLIFLNGCSTAAQVQALLDAGVAAVIATVQAINDEVAVDFAERFYKGLVTGATIEAAFAEAESSIRSAHGEQTRHLYLNKAKEDGHDTQRWPWQLHLRGGVQVALYRSDQNSQTDDSPFRAAVAFTEPRYFFGREKDLLRLFNLWRRPPLQNAAIIGPKRSGKTWLLHHLQTITTAPAAQVRPGQRQDWLPQPERYRWVYADFQDPRLGTQEGLLHHLLTGLELRPPRLCDLENFMDVVSQGLQQPAIILLDELGVALERYRELDDTFWGGLRSLASNQVNGNLGFVLATHESPVQLAHTSGHSSPFFNIFGYTMLLEPLAEPEARAIVATSPIPFDEADVVWILEQSKRWPILLQVLCRERWVTLKDGESDTMWRKEGKRQIESYRSLLV